MAFSLAQLKSVGRCLEDFFPSARFRCISSFPLPSSSFPSPPHLVSLANGGRQPETPKKEEEEERSLFSPSEGTPTDPQARCTQAPPNESHFLLLLCRRRRRRRPTPLDGNFRHRYSGGIAALSPSLPLLPFRFCGVRRVTDRPRVHLARRREYMGRVPGAMRMCGQNKLFFAFLLAFPVCFFFARKGIRKNFFLVLLYVLLGSSFGFVFHRQTSVRGGGGMSRGRVPCINGELGDGSCNTGAVQRETPKWRL